ncbi:inhibin alpha chain [Lampris incognitus]|uniref:inhibin alpha chain n=1 Tax=Lampris incognitus TaxID=2546036 RepID=UPI0024B5DA36|nr:inhibin alpha chain [Lampris incognitus]
MRSCILLLLVPLWSLGLTQACQDDEVPRQVVLALFVEQVMESLGLEKPPLPGVQGPDEDRAPLDARQGHRRSTRTSRATQAENHQDQQLGDSQIILFPSFGDSSCSGSGPATSRHFTYYFQPSLDRREASVTSADFWFFVGEAVSVNSTAPVFLLTLAQGFVQAAEAPARVSSDGWGTYRLARELRASLPDGSFTLQVRCPACRCGGEADQTPFFHIRTRRRRRRADSERSPRDAAALRWSPSVLELLQRPPQERVEYGDCRREEIDISFEELGWENWIVHPKVLTFRYCHGNCSAPDRTAAVLGIRQCCAPVPGSMKSLRVTTTSDGGYSFKYETLPNIIPEECTCI